MPNYRRYKSSITNNTNIYGIMGGLASVRLNGVSDTNRATSKLTIPSDPVKGLAYMREHNLLSVNPQCTGGVGRLRSIGCGCCNSSGSLPPPPPAKPKFYKCVSGNCVFCGNMAKSDCSFTLAQCNGSCAPPPPLDSSCVCNNGIPAPDASCTTPNENICASCNVGYHLEDSSCVKNGCTCKNGTPAKDASCTTNGSNICASCSGAYHLDNSFSCVRNLCDCSHGIPADGSSCTTNGSNICASCSGGYHLNSANQCIHISEWGCSGGAVGDCAPPFPIPTTCPPSTTSSQTIKDYIIKYQHVGGAFTGDPSGYGICVDPQSRTPQGCTPGEKGEITCGTLYDISCQSDTNCVSGGSYPRDLSCSWFPIKKYIPLYTQKHASFSRTNVNSPLTLCNSNLYSSTPSETLDCDGLTVDASAMDNLAFFIRQADLSHSQTYPHSLTDASSALHILNKINEQYHKNVVVGDNEGYRCKAYELQNILQSGWKKCDTSGCITYYNQAFGGKQVNNTKGCGWWGRGVIQTTGPCNFGKLQKTLSANPSYHKKFNLCKTPELICNSAKYPEIKWLAGFNYWIFNIQNGAGRFDWSKDWSFNDALSKAASDDTADCSSCSYALNVDPAVQYNIVNNCYTTSSKAGNTGCSGEQPYDISNRLHYQPPNSVPLRCQPGKSCWTDSSANDLVKFMNAGSGLVNRGCPKLLCKTGVVDAAAARLKYSQIALSILNKAHTGHPDASSLLHIIDDAKSDFEQNILHTYGGEGVAPISTYDFDGFKTALTAAITNGMGANNDKFYDASNSSRSSMMMAKINLASFLGQSMQETLQYGACDENNWTEGEAVDMAAGICNSFTDKEACNANTGQAGICEYDDDASVCRQSIYGTGNWSCETNGPGKKCPNDPKTNIVGGGLPTNFKYYQSTSACGQLGQKYSALTCDDACDTEYLSSRTITASTSAVWTGAPGPLVNNANDGANERYYWDNLAPPYPHHELVSWLPSGDTQINCRCTHPDCSAANYANHAATPTCDDYCTSKLPGATVDFIPPGPYSGRPHTLVYCVPPDVPT